MSHPESPERPERGSHPHHEHRARGPARIPSFALTISDSKDEASDRSGAVIRDGLANAGHPLVGYRIVPDDPERIRNAIHEAVEQGARAVICTGGTGLTRRDSTYEVVSALLVRPIPGFGELFRMLSWQEIQSAAMLSRATAGVLAGGAVVFALPGSTAGVRLGLERLILPELSHIFEQLER